MAEQDVDIAAFSDDEVVDLTVDDEDWDDIEDFSDLEQDLEETTAEDSRRGKDMQGIPWDRMQFSREHYRDTRLEDYRNYLNLKDEVDAHQEELVQECLSVQKGGKFFDFYRNSRSVKSTIVHFQLRNLLWATSKHDLYFMHDHCVKHWNSLTRQTAEVMDLSGGSSRSFAPGLGRVVVSTLCVQDNLVAAGGFNGDLVIRNTSQQEPVCSMRVTTNDNGITNAIEIFHPRTGGTRIMTANNDQMVRLYDAAHFQVISGLHYDWAVNFAAACPSNDSLVAVVGDDPVAQLTDLKTGKPAAALKGHLDYSFAAAWHPDGNLLATGNQDTTTRIWDIRQPGKSLAVLSGRMGAVRSLRFSSDGRFLAMAEPADFVHVFDVKAGFHRSQEIDMFGEISGVCFSPQADKFFVGIADATYSSLLQFNCHEHQSLQQHGSL
ncbi:hypothetical protein WJX82_001381 [Trebouxia sp. C0006]